MALSTKWKQDEDEAIDIAKDIEEGLDWKAVGSPSRRESFSMRGNSNSPPQLPLTQEYRRTSVSSDKPWGSFGGIQWEGPSMFDEETPHEFYDPTCILSVPMLPNISLEPTYKPQRSFSFSMGQDSTFFGYDDHNTRSALAPTMEEDEEHDTFDDAYLRGRSQSSNAVFGINPALHWTNRDRRSSLGFVSFLPDKDPQRRMSQPEFSFPKGNNSYLMASQLTERLENLHISKSASSSTIKLQQQQQQPMIVPDTSVSTPPQQEAASVGKGMLLQKLPPHIPLFMVEFKSGRTDFYYVSDPLLGLRVGDLVIVEADRGKDLGKVATGVLTMDQVVLLQKQSTKLMDENEKTTEAHVKRIYRQANSEEVTMLLVKDQDEQKALSVCLQKIKNKKLPMEVVNAEFQWDRRKLTFYFIAERRIDFRELVRELFKIYKTRIWMCAVNPTRS